MSHSHVQQRERAPQTHRPKGPGPAAGPGPGPKGSALALLMRLLAYLKHHRGLLLVVLIASILTASLELLPPWIIRYTVD